MQYVVINVSKIFSSDLGKITQVLIFLTVCQLFAAGQANASDIPFKTKMNISVDIFQDESDFNEGGKEIVKNKSIPKLTIFSLLVH